MAQNGHASKIVTTGDRHTVTSRHLQLVEREGYEQLWTDRIEVNPGGLRAGNTALKNRLLEELASTDVAHVYDMRALRNLMIMFGGAPPCKCLLQLSSLPNLRLSHVLSAGPSYLLLMATRAAHFTAAVAPRWYVARLLRLADVIVATSNYLHDAVVHDYRIHPDRVRTAILGVKTNNGADTSPDDCPDFLYFGAPGASRGTLDAAEAFRRFKVCHPEAECLVSTFAVKERIGEDLMIIRRLNKRYRAQGVSVMDFLPDIRRRLSGIRAAVLPFRSPFGYSQPPLVVLESLANGAPVISTDIGSVGEIVKDGENGFLVPVGDIGAIVERMEMLWSNEDLYVSMSNAARESAREQFSLDVYCSRLMEIYKESLSG